MAYTFDQIFAADPSNPGNVAANGVVTIFAPGDASQTPLAIMDIAGNPLANPVTVNANGYGDAFSHATLDRVAWAGGGFSGFFTSYEGIKNEAIAAASNAAEGAAAELSARIEAGEFKGRDGSNVVPTAEAIAAEIETPGTLANTALNATTAEIIEDKAPRIVAEQIGPFDSLLAALENGQTCAYQVLGDSTGNESIEWAYLLGQWLGSKFPAFTVQQRLWDDPKGDLGAPATVQTGTAGAAYAVKNTKTRRLPAASIPHMNEFSIRVRASLDDWTPASTQTLISRASSSGTERSWWLSVSASGSLVFTKSVDGTALTQHYSSAMGIADGATKWVRCDFDPDNGAAGNTATFYTSDDGLAWTQLGTPQTQAGTVTLFGANSSADWEIGGRGQAGELMAGKLYEVDIRDTAGTPVAPRLPALWQDWFDGAGMTLQGAPVLTLVNASHPGSSIAYWTAAKTAAATADFGQRVAFLSMSHNEGSTWGRDFRNRYAAWRSSISNRLPMVPLVLLTQNPQTTPRADVNLKSQAARRVDIVTIGKHAGDTVIDTYKAFVTDARPIGDLVSPADGVHPTPAGSQLWAETVEAAFGL